MNGVEHPGKHGAPGYHEARRTSWGAFARGAGAR